MRKRAEKESSGKNEANGPRKSKDILGNKVSVKVSKAIWKLCAALLLPILSTPCSILSWEREGAVILSLGFGFFVV